MTLTDYIARVKGIRTLHGETLPAPGPLREAWKREQAQLDALLEALTARLYEQRQQGARS